MIGPQLFSGLLVNLSTMGDWLSWIRYLSIFRYSLNVSFALALSLSLCLSLFLSVSVSVCLSLSLSHPLCNTAYLAYCAEMSATFQNSVWSSLPCMLNRSYWGTPWLKCQSHFKFQYEAVYLACWTVDLIRAPRGWNVGQTSKFSLKQSTLQRAPYSWNVDQTSRFISDQ